MNKWKGEQIKIKALQIGTFNMKYKIKIQNFFFQKPKFHYKLTCEMGSL
jgi:hypothetical protein